MSLQVLQEYFAAVTRKLKVARDLARRKVEIIAHSKVASFEASDVIAAIDAQCEDYFQGVVIVAEFGRP